jgi:hypothetical protein
VKQTRSAAGLATGYYPSGRDRAAWRSQLETDGQLAYQAESSRIAASSWGGRAAADDMALGGGPTRSRVASWTPSPQPRHPSPGSFPESLIRGCLVSVVPWRENIIIWPPIRPLPSSSFPCTLSRSKYASNLLPLAFGLTRRHPRHAPQAVVVYSVHLLVSSPP